MRTREEIEEKTELELYRTMLRNIQFVEENYIRIGITPDRSFYVGILKDLKERIELL